MNTIIFNYSFVINDSVANDIFETFLRSVTVLTVLAFGTISI